MPPTMKHRAANQNKFEVTKNRKKEPKKIIKKPSNVKIREPLDWNIAKTIVYPETSTAFKALLSARFCAAIWSNISDCDETFNYWEPVHYLMFGQGLQTWEYSPEFGLRSYFYLLLCGAPAWIYQKIFRPNPMLIFYLIRCLFGLFCALTEVYFYKAVSREFGVHVSRIWLCFQLFSAGMFISGAAFLPSSFSMYLITLAMAAWWQRQFKIAIFSVATSTLTGWPFSAILGIPIAFDLAIRQKRPVEFLIYTAISGITILLPMVLVDSYYYGQLVIAPVNIVLYNVFTPHGPTLYGVEPFSFYFFNGFLNYNFIWILALLCPCLLLCIHMLVPAKASPTLCVPHYLSLGSMFLWLIIFFSQPHKEERFLFPIFPMISLCGAISVDAIQKLWYRIICTVRRNAKSIGHYLDHTNFITVGIILTTSIIGISRILTLFNNYHAPMDLMMEINRLPNEYNLRKDITYNVCVGKDWYRYPTSFFFPNNNFKIRFLKSEFDGMLPAYYSEESNGTRIIHSHFNDQNQEVPSLYFDIKKCHFLFDLYLGTESALEPYFAKNLKDWIVLKSLPFLNSPKSHTFFRAFFVPYFGNTFLEYGEFSLLQSTKFKLS